MRSLSEPGTAQPPLISLAEGLDDMIRPQLAGVLPLPGGEVVRRLLRIFECVSEIGQALPFTDDGPECAKKRAPVLAETEALMHEQTSFRDYIRRLLAVLKTAGPSKKSARETKPLDDEFERLFATPINKVKHDAYRLQWMEARPSGSPTAIVRGFYVEGIIDAETAGSAAHRFGSGAIAEAYSYPLMLRQAVVIPYAMCELAACSLRRKFGVPGGGSESPPASREPKRRCDLAIAAQDALMHIDLLPRRGFPNEAGLHVPNVAWRNNSVAIDGTTRFPDLPPGSRFQQASVYQKGYNIRLNYAGEQPSQKVRR